MSFVTGCLDRFLHLPRQLTKKSAFTYATGEEEHNRIITSLDVLSKDICSIDDLPLKIDSVKGLSPVFCYSEVSVFLQRRSSCILTSAVVQLKMLIVINCNCNLIT